MKNIMRKYLSTILLIAFTLGFVACSDDEDGYQPDDLPAKKLVKMEEGTGTYMHTTSFEYDGNRLSSMKTNRNYSGNTYTYAYIDAKTIKETIDDEGYGSGYKAPSKRMYTLDNKNRIEKVRTYILSIRLISQMAKCLVTTIKVICLQSNILILGLLS